MSRIFKFLIVCFSPIAILFSNPHEFLILGPGANYPGMFSAFTTVIGLLDHYEKLSYAGVDVNFGKGGFYYDESKGPNWWNYYFKPIHLGTSVHANKVLCPPVWHVDFAVSTLDHLPREASHELIKKYIHVKSHIRKEVAKFKKTHFNDSYVIGVHYRGTDKMRQEAPHLSYDGALEAIKNVINYIGVDNFKIFLATDEEGFLTFLKSHFPHVVHIDSHRSSDGTAVHMQPDHKYERGKEALIDCLLLSECNYLIRTRSNLSFCSLLFNPSLPSTTIN